MRRSKKSSADPGEFSGKTVTVEGDVTDRTAFFGAVKFFKIRDKTGEIIVVTKGNALPDVKSKVRVKGTVDQAFSVGDEKLIVFVAESVEEEGKVNNEEPRSPEGISGRGMRSLSDSDSFLQS